MTREEWEIVRQALSTPPRTDNAEQRERMAKACEANKGKLVAFGFAIWAAFLLITLQTGGVL